MSGCRFVYLEPRSRIELHASFGARSDQVFGRSSISPARAVLGAPAARPRRLTHPRRNGAQLQTGIIDRKISRPFLLFWISSNSRTPHLPLSDGFVGSLVKSSCCFRCCCCCYVRWFSVLSCGLRESIDRIILSTPAHWEIWKGLCRVGHSV